MNVLKTIFDFVLSLGALFFRRTPGGRKGKQRCRRCGAVLGTGCPCGCGNLPDGGGSGGCGGAVGVEADEVKEGLKGSKGLKGLKGSEEAKGLSPLEPSSPLSPLDPLAAEEEAIGRLVGWALMALGVGQWILQ